MAQHRVTKTIDFCYGHRLLDYAGKCRNLHGHNGLLEVDVESNELDDLGLVMISMRSATWSRDGWMTIWTIGCSSAGGDPVAPVLTEMGEPLYLMDDNPSAENISKLIYLEVRKQGLKVSEVRLWETPTSYAAFRDA